MRDDNDLSPFGTHKPTRYVAGVIALSSRQSKNWLGKRLSFWFRRLGMRALNGPVDVHALGVNLRLYPFSNVCEKRILFMPQHFDEAERALIASRIRPGFAFVDIGANVGGYALSTAALAGAGARILAIEPQPSIFERLVYNIGQNPFGTVKAIACAVADHDGEVTLFINNENRGQSSVKIVPASAASTDSVTVPARTLLTILRDEGLDRVDAAKLDVEGAEDLILEPFLRDAPKTLYPKLLLVENGSGRWQHDIRTMLIDHGYRPILETRNNIAFEYA